MRFFRTITKNFRVLFRMKLSLLAIILGPLIVLSLIGFTFSSSSNIQLSVGYVAPDNSTLTNEFVTTLNQKDFVVKGYADQDSCIKELELGLLHTCIIFPYDFKIEKNKVNNITFFVDKSRVNLAYNVIDSVSENIGIKSDELSKGLTENLITTLSSASDGIDDTLSRVIKVKQSLSGSSSDAQEISDDLSGMDLSMVDVGVDFETEVATLSDFTEDLAVHISNFRDEALSLIDDLQDTASGNETSLLNDLLDEVNDLNDSGVEQAAGATGLVTELETKVSATTDKLDEIEEKFDNAQKLNENSRNKIASLKDSLAEITDNIDEAKGVLEQIVSDINTIEITSSDQIVNPINTKIETVSADNNQLVILFPYVLMLIIMFVGLMLSSTLVVVEKRSRASFRIFTTPTRDEFFILTTFVTSFVIVAMQTLIILAAMKLFLVDLIASNIGINIIILLLSAAVFILLGMAIGYIVHNQQGTNMVSITVGAILLFISNIMLPLETLSPYIRNIANYNPFVISSELLRKSILFNITVQDIIWDLMVLLGYCIFVVIIIILFQQVSKNWYFKRNPHKKTKKTSYSHEYLYFNQEKISNEKEFIEVVRQMTEKEYKRFRRKHKKDLKVFIAHKLNKDIIANRVHKFDRGQLIDAFNEANEALLENLKSDKKKKKK